MSAGGEERKSGGKNEQKKRGGELIKKVRVRCTVDDRRDEGR